MADELKQLISKRGIIKSQLTRFKNYHEKLSSESLNDNSRFQLNARLEKLNPLWDEYKTIQTKIESLCEILDRSLDVEMTERENFESLYFEVNANFNLTINNYNMSKLSLMSGNATSAPRDQQKSLNVKLPDINLPTFNGDYDKWLEFHDTFMSTIHNDQRLDGIRKFLYLKSCLTGEAQECIKSVLVSEANYKVAWQLLRERFENKEMQIKKHVKALFKLPEVQKESDTALRQLLYNVLKNIRCLEALGEPVNQWDRLLIQFVVVKLDSLTKREWKEFAKNLKPPKFKDLTDFLRERCELLEDLSDSEECKALKTRNKKQNSTFCHSTMNLVCNYCKDTHLIYNCEKFLKLSANEKIAETKKLKLCLNCLRSNHFVKDCKARKCFKCGESHHTLLHFIERPAVGNSLPATIADDYSRPTNLVDVAEISFANHSNIQSKSEEILLSTAYIQVVNKDGKIHNYRCLLDCGSQSNFITEELCNKLGVEKSKTNTVVFGINQGVSKIKSSVEIEIHSNHNDFSSVISCLMVPIITENLPLRLLDISSLNIPQNLRLADPSFHKPSKIDILLGSTIFWKLLCIGQIDLGQNRPTLQNTRLGWIIAGTIDNNSINQRSLSVSCFSTNVTENSLDNQVENFWKLEEWDNETPAYSSDEQYVETFFKQNYTRDVSGRFLVSIPLKRTVTDLGDSRLTALNRFYSLEKKLNRDINLRKEYVKFMEEYECLGHMSKINETTNTCNNPIYYLPHHAVVKPTSISTKVRVVFDGSCKSSSGLSLNDVQLVGPTIQSDLFTVLLNFIKYLVAMTSSIAKMYRQIALHKTDRDLHRIFWRKEPDHELSYYVLNTVTYSNLCWHGPSFLMNEYDTWPITAVFISDMELPEAEDTTLSLLVTLDDFNLFSKISSLPKKHTMSLYPFYSTDIDYVGPFQIRDKKSLGFVSRRGRPHEIFSDNATNIVGANTQLKDSFLFLQRQETQDIVSNSLNGILRHFIPPRAPHFGGLWEAGVRSVKSHLKRTMGNALLTFEEFCTILAQVESVFNSRPLPPLSSDPNDFEPLTPVHFLIGRRLTTVSDPDVTHIPLNRLSMFQRHQCIIQHFWKRWSREYLSELQVRSKWKEKVSDVLRVGGLVIVAEDNLSRLKWRIDRICKLHPGPDGFVRVVSVQCATGRVKRAVTKICVLPIEY